MSVAGIAISGDRVVVNAAAPAMEIVPLGGVVSAGGSIPYQVEAATIADQLPAASLNRAYTVR
jgi:hypothetical protein